MLHIPVSFSSKKKSHGGRSSHPSPNKPTNLSEVKCKEPGANINSSRFKTYRRQSLTIPNTERKNSPPLLLGGGFGFENFWCSTVGDGRVGWVWPEVRCWVVGFFWCFGKGWSTIGCEFDVPKKRCLWKKKTEEMTESSHIFHLKKDE